MLFSFLLGALVGCASGSVLRFLPESWLRERWEAPVPRLALSGRRIAFLSVATGWLFAGMTLLSPSGQPGFGRVCGAYGPAKTALLLAVFALLLQIALVDAARRIIPDQHLLLLVLLSVVYLLVSAASPGASSVHLPDVPSAAASDFSAHPSVSLFLRRLADGCVNAAGSGLFAGLLTLLPALPEFFGGTGLLGLGDVKMFAALGFLLGVLRPSDGLFPALSLLLYAFLLNGLFALTALLLRRKKKTDALPMAPAILLAFLVLSMR